MHFKTLCLIAIAAGALGASTAEAQESPWGDLRVSAARIDFDLSGTGSAAGLAVRTSRELFPNIRLEFGGTFARPDQQFGPSTLFAPEAQLQYHWTTGRFEPYAGGGLGAALVTSDFQDDWDPTLSMAVGTTVRLTERVGVTGEFRLRGHEWDFTGTTAELSAGVAWRFGSF